MKFLKLFKKRREESDFSSFFSSPIPKQKKVIKSVVREANKEQQELYKRYKNSISTKLKTS